MKDRISHTEYMREYRKQNKDKILAYGRDYYRKNRDKLDNNAKRYREPNKEIARQKSIQWIKNNPERKKEMDIEYKKNNKQKVSYLNWKGGLKRNFNISDIEYNIMFNKQNGSCKICNTHQSNLKFRLCVDHNHKTGQVRGLLCSKCNSALGLLQDSSQLLRVAANYIEETNTNN